MLSVQVSICLMDPEDYSSYPISQFEEDNVLRELNKCLLAFRQNNTCPILPTNSAATQSDRRNNPAPSANGATGRESKDRERHNSVQRRFVSNCDFFRWPEREFIDEYFRIADSHRSAKVVATHRKT